jgi:hypothetical protein
VAIPLVENAPFVKESGGNGRGHRSENRVWFAVLIHGERRDAGIHAKPEVKTVDQVRFPDRVGR